MRQVGIIVTTAAAVALLGACGGDDTDQATAPTTSAASATPAPNDGLIAFQRLDPDTGKTRLYTVRPDGSELRPITLPGAEEDNDSVPDWSPDGSRIAFRRFFGPGSPGETTDVLTVDRDGKQLTNLTRSSCTGDCLGSEEPAWSPDGRKIAFMRALGPLPPDGPPAIVGIFVMDADGSHVRQLTQRTPASGTEDHSPTWSPDGKRIAFMRSNNTIQPVDASGIYVIDATAENERLLRRMPGRWPGAGAPDWSPDGSRILFSTYCYFGDCGQPPTGAQLFTITPSGKQVHQITDGPGNSYNGRWSPDGKKIVFARNRAVGPEGDVYTMNADGTRIRRVTHTPELDAHKPDWGTPSE